MVSRLIIYKRPRTLGFREECQCIRFLLMGKKAAEHRCLLLQPLKTSPSHKNMSLLSSSTGWSVRTPEKKPEKDN